MKGQRKNTSQPYNEIQSSSVKSFTEKYKISSQNSNLSSHSSFVQGELNSLRIYKNNSCNNIIIFYIYKCVYIHTYLLSRTHMYVCMYTHLYM